MASRTTSIGIYLVGDRRLDALRARADREIQLRHDEVHGLVDEFEDRALVDLIGGNRFGNLGAVEVRAFHFR
jgi:hypothetical protein